MSKKKPEHVRVGERVKAIREAAGYTQERLAELIDVTAQYISGVERGTVGLSVPVLLQMCNVLLVSTDAILMGNIKISDVSCVSARLSRLPTAHVKNAEAMLNCYLEGIAIAQKEK